MNVPTGNPLGHTHPARWQRSAVILSVALAIRLVWAVAVPVVPVSDSFAYHAFATRLAEGGCYGWEEGKPSAYWPVGTAFLYSVAYRIFGTGSFGPVLFNLVSGMGGVMATIALVRRCADRRAAAVAGWLMAVWPWHVQFTTVIGSELHFTALMLAGILCWIRCQSGNWWWAVVAGAVFASDAYLRPTAFLIPVILAGIEFLRGPRRQRTFLMAGCLGLVMAACIAPWTIRNARIFGQFVPVSTNAGSNIWMGNNPATTGCYMQPPTLDDTNEANNDRLLAQEARSYIRAEPVGFLKRTVIKVLRLHERQTIGIAWNQEGLDRVTGPGVIRALKWCGQVFWFTALCAGLIGAAMLIRSQGTVNACANPLLWVWIYFALTHAVIVIQDRYLFPATPMIAGLAGVAIASFVHMPRSKMDVAQAASPSGSAT